MENQHLQNPVQFVNELFDPLASKQLNTPKEYVFEEVYNQEWADTVYQNVVRRVNVSSGEDAFV